MFSENELPIIHLRIISPVTTPPYTLDDLAQIAPLHAKLVERYVEEGLIEPLDASRPKATFDDDSLFELRRIQRLRRDLGVNIAGVGVVLELLRRIEALEAELERYRRSAHL